MKTRQELAQAIYIDGCIWFASHGEPGRELRKHREHPNAPLSAYFVSLRTPNVTTHGGSGTLSQETVDEIGRHLWAEYKTKGLSARFIAPIPNAALAYGEAMVKAAASDGVELKIVRLTKKGEGSSGQITGVMPGEWKPGDEVILIDDLITAAGTKKDAIRCLRQVLLKVKTLMVAIDREQGGALELEKLDVQTIALLLFSAIVEMLTESGDISGYQRGRYDQYIDDDHRYNLDHQG